GPLPLRPSQSTSMASERPPSSKRVIAVQRTLAEYGYGQIKPSGIIDAETQAAIQKFERERKLPITGQASERVVRELAAVTGRANGRRQMRLKSAIWVAAYVRRCHAEGAFAAVRHRGAEEAGAIFVKLNRLDGTAELFGPAPQSVFEGARPADRLFNQCFTE